MAKPNETTLKTKEEGQSNIENLEKVKNKMDQPMDQIAMSIPEKPFETLENKSTNPVPSQENISIEVPHIHFISRGEQWVVKVCNLIMQTHN